MIDEASIEVREEEREENKLQGESYCIYTCPGPT